MVQTVKIFQEDARIYTGYGLGPLPDAIRAAVTEEENGAFTLELIYPFDGFNGDKLQPGNLIFCKARPSDTTGEPFRIYDVIESINRTISVKCNHISYDAAYEVFTGYPNTSVTGIIAACDALNNYRLGNGFIRVWYDGIDTTDLIDLNIGNIKMLSEMLSGSGSLLEAFGGQYRYQYRPDLEREVIYLCARRGVDRDISITYSYNLMDFERERNNTEKVSTIIAYQEREMNGNIQRLYEVFTEDPSAPLTRRMLINVSDRVAWGATRAEIKDAVDEILNGKDVTELFHSITAAVVPSIQFGIDETKLDLCDTVLVKYPELGVSERLKITKVVYNVLTDHYDSVELGDLKKNVADTIAGIETKQNGVEAYDGSVS